MAERLRAGNLTVADKRFLWDKLRCFRSSELEEMGISESEKGDLLEKFKPDPQPWHGELKKAHAEVESRRLNAVRWDGFVGGGGTSTYGPPYRYSHEAIVATARRRGSTNVGTRVTNFSDWVYGLYHERRDEKALARGRRLEQELVRRYVPVPANDTWELIYKGIRSDAQTPSKVISSLTVNGQPLSGKPDLVFKERSSGRILIVEIKASYRTIPLDGWPNLRAQLWAYSQIDKWREAPIVLVGEVWWYSYMSEKPLLRGRLRWSSADLEFNARNSELFELYRSAAQVRN